MVMQGYKDACDLAVVVFASGNIVMGSTAGQSVHILLTN